MAPLHRSPLGAPAISLLLLLAVLASADAAADPSPKKAGVRMRYANKEEAQWLDRYAETHQPLGAVPLRMRPATEEEARWLNRMSESDTTAGRAGDHSHDGEDGGGNYIEFDEDNPYAYLLSAWASRMIKQGMEKAQAEGWRGHR
ncbi:hypothetical protein HU200_058391 [Digitaria exilis]|uniref:Uncharacterized protein n=1 Tax=Digitaria exilis TaxID=1010633 RepID=A0A835ACP4_9POAL|nr:hypothetical protein HU200_058391 [Digitaria exilis]